MLSPLTGESMGTQDGSAHRQQFHEESGLRADIGSAGNHIQKSTFKNHTQEMHSDSFRRHYKENIEDVQSKVLKETSFMRKDLQLSWPQSFTLGSDQTFSNVSSVFCLQDPQDTLESSILSEPDIQVKGKEGREQNLPQIQVVRIAERKRLTPEQRKLCYSDPEKLDLLEDTPYRLCNSLDTHEVKMVSEDGQAKQGLVATRRKIFETKGRALSTSCLSKTTLKHIQHEALVAYMERKMGQKPIESQNIIEQPAINVHSMAGKESVWGMRPQSGKSRNTLARHHSSGHLLDSSSTNEQAWLSKSRETISSAPGKPAFAESLLNQAEEGGFFRARSISIPHGFQHVKNTSASSAISIPQTFSSQNKEDATLLLRKSQVVSVMDNCVAGLSAPSKTTPGELEVQGVSMPLEQPCGRQAARGRNKSTSLYKEGEVKAQGCMHRKSFFNQESAPELGIREDFSETGSCQSNANAITPVSPPGKVCCCSSCSGRSVYGDSPLSLHLCNVGSAKGELSKAKSAPSLTPDQDNIESRNSPRIKTCLPGNLSHLELSVDDPGENASPSFSQEMCLSRGVTIDQDSWFVAGMCAQKENLSPQSDACPNKAPVLAAEPLRTCSTPFHDQKEKAEEEEEEEKGVSVYEHVVHACPEAKTKVRSRWEELVEDVVAEDHSLAHVLFPAINRKTAVSLMEELLSEDTLLMDEHYRRKQTQMSSGKRQTVDSPVMVERFETIAPPCSTYSTPIEQMQQKGPNQVKVESDATEKKRLLVACIKQHLQVLDQSRAALEEEARVNGEQAEAVAALVQARCLPAEYVRYTQFVGDLERVVSLMLCLSARLARVQNALSVVDQNTDAEERESLANRHRLLCKQREDAQDLKNNLDRRERTVSTILAKYLTPEQVQDYQHCVQIKASLLIQQKDLDEKKRLAEEQLESLLNSAPCQGTYMLSPNKYTVPPTVPV